MKYRMRFFTLLTQSTGRLLELIGLSAPLISNTHISSVKIMWLCLQHGPYTIGVFEFDKAEASWLICSFVLHDDTIYYFPILWEIVSQCLWEKKRNNITMLLQKKAQNHTANLLMWILIEDIITQLSFPPEHEEVKSWFIELMLSLW